MIKIIKNPQVDKYLLEASKCKKEMEELRRIALGCGLTEELKWGKPCYTYAKMNIALIQGFREYCALLFFKGHLLSDPERILVKTGPNTETGRQIRFTGIKEITGMEGVLENYLTEAVGTAKEEAEANFVEPGPQPDDRYILKIGHYLVCQLD